MNKTKSNANLKKDKDKPTKKDEKKPKDDKSKKKKKSKKKVEEKKEIQIDENPVQGEELKSRELLAIEKEIEKIDKIVEQENLLNLNLDSLLQSESLTNYSNPEKYSKLNRNAMFQSNLPLEKYEDSLTSVNVIVQETLDGLQESKCIHKLT
jgi:hypothetical protein